MEGEGARAEVKSWDSQEGGVSEGSSVQLAPLTWLRLIPFRSRRDTEALLLSILPLFVNTVDVEKSGLMEELMAAQVVTPRDAQSLSGPHRPTTTEKARRLWEIFMDINYKRFVKKVLPCLCKYYWYLIPEKFWLPGNAPDTPHLSYLRASRSGDSGGSTECVRCAIRRRIRPPQLGDFLVSARLISRKFHATISKGYRTSDTDWHRIFRSFKRLKGQKLRRPVRAMRDMLISHSLSAPDDLLLSHLMIQGFPCTCPARRQIGLCLPMCGGKSLSSSDFSLPSDHSEAGISTASSLSIPSTFPATDHSSYDTESDHTEDFSQTPWNQVSSLAESNPGLYEEYLLRNSEGCEYSGEEATPTEEGFGFDPEGKLPSRSDVEDETSVKQYAEARDTPDMTSAWPDQAGCGDDGGDVRLSDEELGITMAQNEEAMESYIVDEFRHNITTPSSVEIDMLDKGREDSESHPMFSTSFRKDCAIVMEGPVESTQAKHAFFTEEEEEEGYQRMGTGSELSAGPSESAETLISHVRLEGLQSQVALGFSRLCGRYSRLGLFVSSHKKFVKVSCGHFWVSLALLFLLALPALIIVKGVFSTNYELIIAGFILLSVQFLLCFWLKKQISI